MIRFMVAIALLGGQALAAESVTLNLKSKPMECAWYRYNFSNKVGQMTEAHPKLSCTLTDSVGATCYMRNHGLEEVAWTVIKFVGDFRVDDDNVLVEVSNGDVLNLRLKCLQGYGCLFQFWNEKAQVGYSCNLEKWNPTPPKPVTQPPPLLRRPSKPTTQPDDGWKL